MSLWYLFSELTKREHAWLKHKNKVRVGTYLDDRNTDRGTYVERVEPLTPLHQHASCDAAGVYESACSHFLGVIVERNLSSGGDATRKLK